MTAHLVFFVGDDGVVRGAGIFSDAQSAVLNFGMVMLTSDIAVGRGETYDAAVADLRAQFLTYARLFGRDGSRVRRMLDVLADEHFATLPEVTP